MVGRIQVQGWSEVVHPKTKQAFAVPVCFTVNNHVYMPARFPSGEAMKFGGLSIIAPFARQENSLLVILKISISTDLDDGAEMYAYQMLHDLLQSKFMPVACQDDFVQMSAADQVTVEMSDGQFVKQTLLLLEALEEDLIDFVEKSRQLSMQPNVTRSVLLGTLRALRCLHSVGIAFGDLKLDQFLCSPHASQWLSRSVHERCSAGFTVKLSDLDSMWSTPQHPNVTATTEYCSPERYNTRSGASLPDDMWAFAQMMYIYVCLGLGRVHTYMRRCFDTNIEADLVRVDACVKDDAASIEAELHSRFMWPPADVADYMDVYHRLTAREPTRASLQQVLRCNFFQC